MEDPEDLELQDMISECDDIEYRSCNNDDSELEQRPQQHEN